jgi:hypothetical protein
MAVRRGLLGLVLLALVMAQTLGLMHRVAHHSGAEQPASLAALHDGDDHGWLAGLFSSHEESGCPVYDQLGHGATLPELRALPLPLVPAAFILQWFQGEVLARWAALYDARGPPSVR